MGEIDGLYLYWLVNFFYFGEVGMWEMVGVDEVVGVEVFV